MNEDADAAVRRYYAALRAGEPLHPFFADEGLLVKAGVWSRHVGADAVAAELREQTATTGEWVVESRDLRVGTAVAGGRGRPAAADDGGAAGAGTGGDFAWFGDDVLLAWTDRESGERFEFDTRWSGALVRRESHWRFVAVHVSVAEDD